MMKLVFWSVCGAIIVSYLLLNKAAVGLYNSGVWVSWL